MGFSRDDPNNFYGSACPGSKALRLSTVKSGNSQLDGIIGVVAANFQLVDGETLYLLSPPVAEWLPENHLAYFIEEIINQLDISILERVPPAGARKIEAGFTDHVLCSS